MSKLEKLIGTLCCGGVEYQELGLLGRFYGGLTGKTKSDFVNGNAKLITYKNVYSNPALDINPVDTVNIYDSENQRTLEYGDVIFTGSSETPDECGFSSVVTKNPTCDLYLNSFCFFFRFNDPDIILPDFSKHLFRSERLRYQIGKTANGVTRFNVSKDKMAKIKIPLPPLPVQQEIVRILDSFTELTAELTVELTAELTARKKQYAYYRDELLNFGERVEYKKLGQIATIQRGASPRPIKNYITSNDSGVNWIKIGDVKPGAKYITETEEKITQEGAKKSRLVRENDFILSNSMSFGRPYIVKLTGCIHDGWLSISNYQEHFSADFLYHLLSSNKYQGIMKQKASFGGAVQNLNADIVRAIELPIIPLKEQTHIVSILDRFDALCNDLTSGLPAEITARQKQYEYYRDKLLTFKELTH